MTAQVEPLELATGLCLVGASAGSGKTFRLTREVADAVSPDSAESIAVQGLVGVTYTKKAQAELEARIRRQLLQAGHFDRAGQLPLALLGTVHAVSLRLLKEFALDAGLSPEVDVIAGNDGQRLLRAALEHALPPELRAALDERAAEFQLGWDGRVNRYDWVSPVDDIMTLARSNRIAAEQLPEMGRRSAQALRDLLPPPAPEGAALERALEQALALALEQLSASGDDTKKTAETIPVLRSSAEGLRRGQLPWNQWAKLTRLDPAKKLHSLVQPVRDAAAAYDTHPRFGAHLAELTERLFDAAQVGLAAYASWKAERGLLDYVDMIDRALQVLDSPDVATELSERLELLVVDEFQDTSPIQLALFMRLHALCGRSVWVGDQKQCIFEYAGADPALMASVTRWTLQSGGQSERLGQNHRSRPELVELSNTLFAAAFAAQGFTAAEVVTTAARSPDSGHANLPPLGLWWLEGDEEQAIAQGIARLLQAPEQTPVLDRATGAARPVRPGDIAVLVYSNAEAAKLSAALKLLGIPSVLPRVGLLVTPEGTFVSAALRFLVDVRDSLASAELDALTGFNGRSPDEWLAQRIQASAEKVDPGLHSPWRAGLDALRLQLPLLSPAETLDRVLAVLDVAAMAVRWPDPDQRLSNLEALRALAAHYEERCDYQREAATLPGLLRYFEETQQKIRQRDEERATDEQHVDSSANAVAISTFHKSKGLEWPVVIVSSLDRERRRDAFEVTPETDRAAFDAADPLGGRWIRYWPWPLAQQQRTTAPLALRAAESTFGRAVSTRDHRERVRLLYVAFTRPRDHLILAVRLLKKGPSIAWLNELSDDRGPLLTLPAPDAPTPELAIRGLDGRFALTPRTWRLNAKTAADSPDPHHASSSTRYWFARPAQSSATKIPRYRISPSQAEKDPLALPQPHVIASTRFTRRMTFTHARGTTWDTIGNALHTFLAADDRSLTPDQRSELAQRVLANAELGAMFAPDTLLAASDAFRTYIDTRWPGAEWHREIPISALLDTEHGARRIEGTIDLLLKTDSGYVIVDHKSFPGREEHWTERALKYAPQLFTYEKAIRMTGAEVTAMLVHFTVGGGVVEVGGVSPLSDCRTSGGTTASGSTDALHPRRTHNHHEI
ncbi:MAG: UvrD-helicase domain-containing protein [Myxococcota bacterium]|nr:UvrD-helicase domain-containing protein [Myxococcota bacterium]